MKANNFVDSLIRKAFMEGVTRHQNWEQFERSSIILNPGMTEEQFERFMAAIRTAFMLGFSRNFKWTETEGISV